jgi:hypothetical protein
VNCVDALAGAAKANDMVSARATIRGRMGICVKA